MDHCSRLLSEVEVEEETEDGEDDANTGEKNQHNCEGHAH